MMTPYHSKGRVGITCSAFDMLHPGHVSMLEEAKKHCHWLVCALHVDPSLEREDKDPPLQSLVSRYTQLRAVQWVDEIIPYETESELCDLFQLRHFDVRIIGSEYQNQMFTAKVINLMRGTEIVYNSRDHRFSSTMKRKQFKHGMHDETFLQDDED
ncbi:MAG: adenylyltransferase/cytidyltransferase family protein [Alphaproteobacteria bacterium]